MRDIAARDAASVLPGSDDMLSKCLAFQPDEPVTARYVACLSGWLILRGSRLIPISTPSHCALIVGQQKLARQRIAGAVLTHLV